MKKLSALLALVFVTILSGCGQLMGMAGYPSVGYDRYEEPSSVISWDAVLYSARQLGLEVVGQLAYRLTDGNIYVRGRDGRYYKVGRISDYLDRSSNGYSNRRYRTRVVREHTGTCSPELAGRGVCREGEPIISERTERY